MNKALLEVSGLSMRFGGLLAVNGVSLTVREKEIVSVIGPNGAGKTTVFNCISGFYTPTEGTILFDGEQVQGLKGHKIARKGMVRTFQHVRLFKDMTVIENLLVAQHLQMNTNLLSGFFKTPSYRAAEERAMQNAAFWLKKVNLLEMANREAGNLSYGQQRRLEIARCMVTHPRLLMLDEPAAGLNPNETKELDELICNLRDEFDVSILLIEHDMSLVMNISEQVTVLDYGRKISEGTPEQVQNDPQVIEAYLGTTGDEVDIGLEL